MNDCSCDANGFLSFDSALQQLLAAAPLPVATHDIPLEAALGRVLAEPVIAALAVPPAANSAMDGYAVDSQNLPSDLCLPVTQRITAGQQGFRLQPGSAARVFTGSEIPPGADAVVMQEACKQGAEEVTLQVRPKPGDHIRLAGQDMQPGQVVAGSGIRLDAATLGVIAAVGQARVRVFPRLRVTVLTTGDELQLPGEPPRPGQIFNSNYFTLRGLLEPMGVEVCFPGIVEDSPEATRHALAQAAEHSDLVISSGGVSVGEEDHVRTALEALGELSLWRLAIKPGKPLAFGRIGKTPVIGLPGNPAAVLVTFMMLARPFLRRMQGMTELLPQRYPVQSGFQRDKVTTRLEFLRAGLTRTGNQLTAAPVHNQSSGVLSSAALADGLLLIPPGDTVRPGLWLEFIPFSALMS